MRRVALIGAVLSAAVAAAWWALSRGDEAAAFPVPGENGERMIVEVLNGTDVDGLARRTTRRLRRHGFDVVYFGSAAADTFSTTLVLARRGDTTAAVRVRRALGTGVVRLEPDPRLLLDVSVILGADASPLLDLYP